MIKTKERNLVDLPFEEIKRLCINLQLDRVIAGYPELMNESGFDQLPDFFRNYLYAASNRSQRVETIEKLRKKISAVSGKGTTRQMDNLIELAKVAEELDESLAEEVFSLLQEGHELNYETLALAIKRAGGVTERIMQIIDMGSSLRFFFRLTNLPFINLFLSPIKIACNLFGAGYLADTIEEGYRISKGINDLEPFITSFVNKELDYLGEIFPENKNEILSARDKALKIEP